MVRNWCQKRVKNALLEEMRDRGYDKEGRRVGRNGELGKGKDLVGSLELFGFEALVTAEWQEVRRQVGLVIERVKQMCEGAGPENGKHGRGGHKNSKNRDEKKRQISERKRWNKKSAAEFSRY